MDGSSSYFLTDRLIVGMDLCTLANGVQIPCSPIILLLDACFSCSAHVEGNTLYCRIIIRVFVFDAHIILCSCVWGGLAHPTLCDLLHLSGVFLAFSDQTFTHTAPWGLPGWLPVFYFSHLMPSLFLLHWKVLFFFLNQCVLVFSYLFVMLSSSSA